MKFTTLAALAFLLLAAPARAEESEPAQNEEAFAETNALLRRVGIPQLPEKATDVRSFGWTGLSAGVYAVFVLKEPEFTPYLQTVAGGMQKSFSPIPPNLLPLPNAGAPWFNPGSISPEAGTVLTRTRLVSGAREQFSVYIDKENFRVFLFYTWNNLKTYP